MTFLAQVCAFCSIVYIVKTLLFPIFKPVSRKQRQKTRQYLQERKASSFRNKLLVIKKEIATSVVRKLMSYSDIRRYQMIIDRLDLGIKPEEIRLDQFLYAVLALLISSVMYLANPLLGYVSAIFIILGWLYPINNLEQMIEKKNKNISLEFPAFYSMVYYQYSKAVSIYLSDVIKDYLPNANEDMAEELGVMLDNIEYGEEYALKQFKKRVPLHYIIKFCDIMETRLRGYDNISQMAYLKNEMDDFRIRNLEDELERRERKNARLQMVLVIILVAYIMIYYLFTIIGAIKLFQ